MKEEIRNLLKELVYFAGKKSVTDGYFDKIVEDYTAKLVTLFKCYLYKIIPERKEIKYPVARTLKGYEEVYDVREVNFVDGWNICREKMLEKIKKEMENVL